MASHKITNEIDLDFKILFEAVPDLYLVLLPDLTIQAASNAYLKATLKNREEIIGRYVFDVFPDNPQDQISNAVSNTSASLAWVLKHKEAHSMPVQRHDVRRADGSSEQKYWSLINTPVFNSNKEIIYIIHRVEDVTKFINLHQEQPMEIVKRANEINTLNENLEKKAADRTEELEKLNKDILDYKYALDASSIVAVTNHQGIIQYANDNFCKVSKYSREELIGQDHRIINSSYHSKEYMRNLWSTISKGSIWKGELRNRAKDGTIYWVDTTIVPFLNDNGKPFKYLAIRSDITQRKLAEEELRKSEIKYHNLFDNSQAAISAIDMTTEKVIDINEKGARLFGYSSKEDFLQHFDPSAHFIHSEDVTSIAHLLISTGSVKDKELELKKLDGSRFWVMSSGKKNLDNNIAQSVMIDITDLKKVEEQLRMDEQRLRFLVDHTPAGVAMLDAHMRYLMVSKRWLEDYKLEGRDIIGLSHYEVFPEITARWKELHKRCLAGESLHCEEDNFVQSNGQVEWLRWELCPWYTTTHEVGGIILFTELITKRKQAEKELKASEEKYRNVFENSLAAMFVVDATSEVKTIDVNETGVRLFGYKSKSDFLAHFKPEAHYVHLEDREKSVQIIKEGEKDTLTTEQEMIKLDGTRFWAKTFMKINTQKRIVQTVVIDISENKRSRSELEALVQEQTLELNHLLEHEKELNEMKTRFVSTASHEFRTPLSSILSSVYLIENYNEEGQEEIRKKYSNRIRSSVKNLVSILNDFLSVDKLDQGKIDITHETFDLSEFSADVIEELNYLLKPGQRIIFTHQGEEKITLDKKILRNILLNLLSNAIKYSHEQQVIHFSVEKRQNVITMNITDEGIGIPEEEQKNLFEKFFRAKNVSAIQGTGLGLNIVKKYVELLGGTLSFTSKFNLGTTFTIEFPQPKT